MNLWLAQERAGLADSRPLAKVLDAIPWSADGLITTIAPQQHDSGEVLMLAWVNRLHKPVGQALSCSAVPHPQGTP
jgi:phosphoribosyl-AMP cyclohydrolase